MTARTPLTRPALALWRRLALRRQRKPGWVRAIVQPDPATSLR